MTTPPIGTIFKRFVGSNPIGLAYTGIAALELQIGLASENPVPETFTGADIENLRKRLFHDEMSTNPPTKRIRHHDGDTKEAPGGAVNDYKQINGEQVMKLYAQRIRLPALATGLSTRNQRKHDIFLKGIKIDFQVFGLHANATNPTVPAPSEYGYMGPVVVNWALIQLDCARDIVGDNNEDATMVTELKPEFWSSYESTLNESRDFTGVGPFSANASLGWQDYMLSGRINPHHPMGFKILAREKFHLQQVLQNGAGGPGQKNWGRVQKYYKIPQYVYLQDNNEQNWNHPLYMVHWITPLCPSYLFNYPTAGTAKMFDSVVRTTMFFNNIDD